MTIKELQALSTVADMLIDETEQKLSDMERVNRPIAAEVAKEFLALDLDEKEIMSIEKIDEWYHAWGGRCYVSFSGGKDSTILAYLAAKWLASFRTPPCPLTLVFVNTGLEYPEIQHFVSWYAEWLSREFPRIEVNLVRLRPKLNIRQVIARYGYPVVSKEVANCVELAKKGNETRLKRVNGELLNTDGSKSSFNCDRWKFLMFAPFAVSASCCRVMKKAPAQKYERKCGEKPIVASMAEESRQRMLIWRATSFWSNISLSNTLGCNAFEGGRPVSKPMSFWTEQDVLRYIRGGDIPICEVYGEIVASDGENEYLATLIDEPLRCTGCQRTGCMFCAFGAHLERGENRFERMRRTHPRHYEFCMCGGEVDPADGLWKPSEKGLGFAKVLDFIGVKY